MRHGWGMVKLGDVLKQDKASAVSIDPSKNYEMVGVYSFGRGLFHRITQMRPTSYKYRSMNFFIHAQSISTF